MDFHLACQVGFTYIKKIQINTVSPSYCTYINEQTAKSNHNVNFIKLNVKYMFVTLPVNVNYKLAIHTVVYCSITNTYFCFY